MVNQRIAVPAGFMVLVASFVALAPLSTDFYLPVLPSMSLALDASASQTQLVITAVLLGMALGQLVGGPLSDQRGRRGTLIAGLALGMGGCATDGGGEVTTLDFFQFKGEALEDFAGIIDKVPYLASLGVDAVWLSPFYPSELADGGYDVADYRNVDPRIGTLDEFDTLIGLLHQNGIRLFVDIVPNHSSDHH